MISVLVVLCAGVLPSGAASQPPACDPTLNPCERLSWIEQVMLNRDRETIPHLRAMAVGDAHERVRERSLGALVILGDTGASAQFLDRLSGDPSPGVRRAAAEGIGMLKLPVQPERLTEALLKDSNPLVRAECARAIGRLGRTTAAAALISALLQDPSPEVRALCAEALGGLQAQGVAEFLKRAAQEESPIVRLYAIRALVESAPSAAGTLFQEVWETTSDPEARIEAFRGLLRSADAVKWAETGLAHPDERIRFLSLREWLSRLFIDPRRPPGRIDAPIRRIEPFLTDSSRGIRELAKAYLEKLGFRVRPSGFFYAIQE